MAVFFRSGFCVLGSNELGLKKRAVPFSNFEGFEQFRPSKFGDFSGLKSEFKGTEVIILEQSLEKQSFRGPANFTVHSQGSICISRSLKWWAKSLKPNMIEIKSAQELVDSLLNAEDKLVIIDFYSPGCGGCKALHPKICQLAESNPNVQFVQVNYEEHKSMCHSLHIHVLPFFRFYRGAEGRVSSFSCTNATIKKFKDALAKHGTDRCSLGPAKGLEESELLNLASLREISFKIPSRSAKEKTDKFVNQMEVEEENAVFAV
ncbi:thioredoxin-like 1-1, chloroplastic [Tasmannia lanceolata]|uniref:thioredoxin-like 1-1, chloroplastic n=1 Tax=Tasmannia lanceolata TaxID=3420 RepID=UPI004062AF89